MADFDQWMADLSLEEILKLKFYDEVGATRRNAYPTHGRSKKGAAAPSVPVDFRGWWTHFTSGCLMSLDGSPPIFEVRVGGFNGDAVVGFLGDTGFAACWRHHCHGQCTPRAMGATTERSC